MSNRNEKTESKTATSPTKPPRSGSGNGSVRKEKEKEVAGQSGEALQECTDTEWESSDEPYAAELLKVKKDKNRVSVFSGTEYTMETIRIEDPQSSSARLPLNQEFHGLARLIQKTCELFIENPKIPGETELHIKLEFPDDRNETPSNLS